MNKMYRFLSCLFISFSISSTLYGQVPVNSALATTLQGKIDDFVIQNNLPGISVSMLLPGNQYWNGASGLSDIYSLDPMDTNYLFHLCSMNKMYVSAMIFQLKEQGLLSLSDTIGMYVPATANIPSSTTIANLLKHRTGIADVTDYPGVANIWYGYPDSIWSHLQTIQTLVGQPIFAQGTNFDYSNTNYILLGMVIEQITGNTFAHELHQRFLSPLNLSHSFFRPQDSLAAILTPGWTSFSSPNVYNTDASPVINDCSASMLFTAGSMFATPSDVCRFTRELWSGNIISTGSLDTMKQCTNVNFGGGCDGYGYGTMRYQFNGKTYYGHAGDFFGFTQLTIHQQEDSVTLTLSVNRNGAPRGPMAQELLALIDQVLSVPTLSSLENSISIYPNPATSFFKIEDKEISNTEFSVLITDYSGRVLPFQSSQSDEGILSIDVRGFKTGVYTINVQAKNAMYAKKLVVIH